MLYLKLNSTLRRKMKSQNFDYLSTLGLVKVPGYPFVSVNKDGVCYNNVNQVFLKPVVQSGKSPKIVTTIRGVTLRIRQAFLIAAAFVPLPDGYVLPENANRLDLNYLDGNYLNLTVENLAWKLRPDIPYLLSEAAGDDRIFPVPSVPGLAVSRKGDAFSLQTGNQLSVGDTPTGYLKVDTYLNGKLKTFQHHRLIAEVFCPPRAGYTMTETIELFVVNHKNSIRTDNRPENLEWVTSQENTDHGYENDRMKKNIKLVVKHLETGEVRKLRSIFHLTLRAGISYYVLQTLHVRNVLDKVIVMGYSTYYDNGSTNKHIESHQLYDKVNPYFKFLFEGNVRFIGRLEDMEKLLPSVTQRVQPDGTILFRSSRTDRGWGWTIEPM